MSFTQPCFIRKNTQELRRKLEGIGYVSCCPFDSRCDAICVFVRNGKAEYLNFKIDEDFEVNIKDSFPFVDAGTNEDLFLALAALRDDSDKNQWFASNYWDKKGSPDEWRFCTQDDYKDFFGDCPYIRNYDDYHKATVEELIEHFKE